MSYFKDLIALLAAERSADEAAFTSLTAQAQHSGVLWDYVGTLSLYGTPNRYAAIILVLR
jgi:hypothetical protein